MHKRALNGNAVNISSDQPRTSGIYIRLGWRRAFTTKLNLYVVIIIQVLDCLLRGLPRWLDRNPYYLDYEI